MDMKTDMKILFITGCDITDVTYGGAVGSKTRYQILKGIAETDYALIRKKSNLSSALSILQRNFPPLLNSDINDLVEMIERNAYDTVVVDASVYGGLIQRIKEKLRVKALCLLQNCEYDYIDVRIPRKRVFKKALYKLLVRKSERLSVSMADMFICLSERDSNRVKELYGKEADMIIPFAMNSQTVKRNNAKGSYCLLFGPDSVPNYQGFQWFVKRVSPFLEIPTLVAGKGMDVHKAEFESEKARVLGYVDDLGDLYSRASCVAIPLFDGGGMKIKTAEALMHGKYIFGTDEAFSGYAFDVSKVGALCNSADEFIKRVNEHAAQSANDFNEYAYRYFRENHSSEVASANFQIALRRLWNDYH